MIRNLISCPNCTIPRTQAIWRQYKKYGESEEGDAKLNLAEYLPEGILSIRTSYKTYKNEIIPLYVQGSDFQLVCGNCKQIAFRKQPVLITQTTTLLFGTV